MNLCYSDTVIVDLFEGNGKLKNDWDNEGVRR